MYYFFVEMKPMYYNFGCPFTAVSEFTYCNFLSINLQTLVLNAHILQFRRHHAFMFVLTKPIYYGFKCPYITLSKVIHYTLYRQNLYATILNAQVLLFQRPFNTFF